MRERKKERRWGKEGIMLIYDAYKDTIFSLFLPPRLLFLSYGLADIRKKTNMTTHVISMPFRFKTNTHVPSSTPLKSTTDIVSKHV